MTENATSIDLPSEVGQSILVIDATPGDYNFDGHVSRMLGS
jgi:hypothetical protein